MVAASLRASSASRVKLRVSPPTMTVSEVSAACVLHDSRTSRKLSATNTQPGSSSVLATSRADKGPPAQPFLPLPWPDF